MSESTRKVRFFKAFTAAAASIVLAWSTWARASSALTFPIAIADFSKASLVRVRAA